MKLETLIGVKIFNKGFNELLSLSNGMDIEVNSGTKWDMRGKNLRHLYTLSQQHEIPYDLESEPKR